MELTNGEFPLSLRDFLDVMSILGKCLNPNLSEIVKVLACAPIREGSFPITISASLGLGTSLVINFTNFELASPDQSLFIVSHAS